ncbi:Transcription factor MafG [Gossypium arboreum]|uniref:Transcription factor MafG n=1 Tax=Gossypium arboreum TaxID=29729 RepID=A0A0B0PX78_GOSAR|nr:Transcription factor MafG [Gossypium arboreum]
MPVCPWSGHTYTCARPCRVPLREYTNLCHMASHTLVCEAVWSILTSI